MCDVISLCLLRKLPWSGVDTCYTVISKMSQFLGTVKIRNSHSLETSTFICDMPACVTTRGTPHSPKGILVKHSKIVFFSTGGPFWRRPRAADLGAAHLARRGIDRGSTGRESRPRPRPVARAARSQNRKIESVSRVAPPSPRFRAGDVKPAM